MNIFLIGKSLNDKNSFRAKVYDSLQNKKDINIYLPEHIFVDELFNRDKDLLSLENILADSVHAIVMCVESAGSIAELGAFANHEILKDKLIVFIDKKYLKDKSFIRMGPIKFLHLKSSSKIVWHDFDHFSNEDRNALVNNLKEVSNPDSLNTSISNPIVAERFLLALFYVFGNYSRKRIIYLLKFIQEKYNIFINLENVISIVSSSLSMLLKRSEINGSNTNYQLTDKGLYKLDKDLSSQFIHSHLDKLRLRMLSSSLRKYWNRRSS